MYRYYRWIYDLMGFSRSQANGFLIFLPLMTLVVFSEPIYRTWLIHNPPDNSEDFKRLDSLVAVWSTLPNDSVTNSIPKPPKQQLDVNTASMTELIDIGLPKSLAGRIISYRSRGGKFKSLKDLKKIYGMDSTLLANISPYLTFPTYSAPKIRTTYTYSTERVIKPSLRFDINLVDTAGLKKIAGIGDKLSVRIIRYRESLGGFISLDQLGEIYRLDTAVIRRIKYAAFVEANYNPVRININETTERDLSGHPYLSKTDASRIVAYRFKHGKFNSIDDLAKVKALDTASIRRLAPYLEFR